MLKIRQNPALKRGPTRPVQSGSPHQLTTDNSPVPLLAVRIGRRFKRTGRCARGACYFGEQRWIDELTAGLQRFNGERYQLSCFVIMPNHCHAVIRPHEWQDFEQLVGAIKGIAARQINSAIGGQWELWQQECYDRIIRDVEHLQRVIQYIGRNPAGLKLPPDKWPRWIDSQWEKIGYGFRP
jgi:putative transposase